MRLALFVSPSDKFLTLLLAVPHANGQLSIPLAKQDRPGAPGPVDEQVIPTMHLADEFLDVKFTGRPAQCGTEQECAKLEREFDFDGYMPVEEQNQVRWLGRSAFRVPR